MSELPKDDEWTRDFDPAERDRPTRQEGYYDETLQICEIITNQRGDQRIGQLLINAMSHAVDSESYEDVESREDVALASANRKATIEQKLWNIEAPELLKLLRQQETRTED